jgi:hypothetical protein
MFRATKAARVESILLPLQAIFATSLVFHGVFSERFCVSLLHIVPFCEGPNKKSEGFAKEKQKT